MKLATKNQSFTKSDRVLKREIFLKARGEGRARKSRHFVVVELQGASGELKLGITASRRIGNAVKRNRVKRLVREFFRLNKERLKSDTHYIVIARRDSHTLMYDTVYNELRRLMF